MSKRLSAEQIPSEDLQGPGSWVRVSRLTVAGMREARRQRQKAEAENKEFNAFEFGIEVLKTHVLEWNWVNDDGNPLPQVPENPDVIDLLTDPEVTFLGECIQGSEEAAKN